MKLTGHEYAAEMADNARIALWNCYNSARHLPEKEFNNYCWRSVRHAILRAINRESPEVELSDNMDFGSAVDYDSILHMQNIESRLSDEASLYLIRAAEICPRENRTKKAPKREKGWGLEIIRRRMRQEYGYDTQGIKIIEREIKLAMAGKIRQRENPAMYYSRALQQGDFSLPCSPVFALESSA